ncbi:ergothioneine biosynthesis protein EgtB [Synechococcus sp. CC9311]|uniref:ergothioneine biosynthesis protein EgtB n=1 Tax=Synechococcus sp. (strain CC9311) TaxID=64471 RepID=UPI00186B76E1|nr:ergothioneine biosynthesis protein EgtB [Synechococcus sp. CC9311]
MESGTLLSRLMDVRRTSEVLIEPLEAEDLCLQGMADASPPKWHLAHTTWFFETFVLIPHCPGYEGADPSWNYLFNSYYDAVGPRQPRPQRGLLSRPPIAEVIAWRHKVDQALENLLEHNGDFPWLGLVELGLQHEQQHQELMLMDLLDAFSRQPLEPAYRTDWQEPAGSPNDGTAAVWLQFEGGLVEIGQNSQQNNNSNNAHPFHFDNEEPRHRVWLEPYALADRLVSNGEYKAFIEDGGYERPELWMSEGWAICSERQWKAPRYWRQAQSNQQQRDQTAWEFTLAGRCPLEAHRPVRHLSWFEADAYARWAGSRLPTEAEWETAAQKQGLQLKQKHAELWQWTASPYRPYPGFQAAQGAVGEYNGKFMTSQFVLRGSSQLTPNGHARDTYRNFFAPSSRWMAAGLRLAR